MRYSMGNHSRLSCTWSGKNQHVLFLTGSDDLFLTGIFQIFDDSLIRLFAGCTFEKFFIVREKPFDELLFVIIEI